MSEIDDDPDEPVTDPDDYRRRRKRGKSRRQRYIEAMAQIYVDRRFGAVSGNAIMGKAFKKGSISRYAKNWLAQHGELPQGVHACLVRGAGGIRISRPTKIEVDFTALWNQVPSSARGALRPMVLKA